LSLLNACVPEYVNDLALGYGERGRTAVERLMTVAFEKG